MKNGKSSMKAPEPEVVHRRGPRPETPEASATPMPDRPVVVFSCGRKPREACTSIGCTNTAETTCIAALKGKKDGLRCGRKICLKCAGKHGVCPPHARQQG